MIDKEKEPRMNEASYNKELAIWESQERLYFMLLRKRELMNDLGKIGDAYAAKELYEAWDKAIVKEAKVLMYFLESDRRQEEYSV